MTVRYHRLKTGEWTATGSRAEIKIGPVQICKRDHQVCDRIIDEVTVVDGKVIGYLTEHCKPESREAREVRVTTAHAQ